MNWSALMGFGFGTLHLSPAAFWSMTPRELTAAASILPPPPMDRTALDAMAAQYPDIPP